MVMELCAGCRLPIADRFLLNIADRPWHEVCVQCSVCSSSLIERCFFREGRLFCREDFYKNFGKKCAGCSHGISPHAMVRKSREKIFHVECFTCLICRRQLTTGEELFFNDDDTFVCKQDFASCKKLSDEHLQQRETPIVDPNAGRRRSVAEVSLDARNSPHNGAAESETKQEVETSDCESVDTSCSFYSSTPSAKTTTNNNIEKESGNTGDVERATEITTGVVAKRRGPRTTIKIKQLDTLKAAFAATPKPTRHIREQLAKDTGLSMRVIQVWFQNRRSKERRMKQLNVLGTRRQFFRNPRRIRSFRSGDSASSVIDDSQLISSNGFPYFPDNVPPEFYHPGFVGFSSYIDPIAVPPLLHEVSFLQPSSRPERSIVGPASDMPTSFDASSTSKNVRHFGGDSSLHGHRVHQSAADTSTTLSIQASKQGNGDVRITGQIPFVQQHLEKPWVCL